MIGPPEVVGPAIGVDRTTLYQWLRPSKHRDAGDIPSARNMRRLLAYAAARGIPLRADHLIFGAHRTEIEALMKTPRPPMPPAIPAPARPEAAA
jgi:hypothetical protein